MYRRSRSPASFSDRSLGSYNSGLSFGGYNTSDLVNTYSPRNRSVQRVIHSDLGIHERSRSPLRDYSSPVSRATSVRPLPTLPPSPTLRRRDLSGLGSDSRLSPIDWATGDDYSFSVKPKSYYDFPSASSTRYNSYSSIGIKRPQRTDYSDYFRPLLSTKPMLKSGYVPRPRSERESAAEPIVRERKLIKFREITNDILSRVKRKVSWDLPDEISSPLINDMKSGLDSTKENINEPSRSRDSSLTKYGSREALNRDSSLTRYGSKETLSRDCSLTRSKLTDESGSPKSVSRRSSSSHSTDRLSPRNLMRLATSRIKDGDPNTMEGQPKVVPRKKSLGAIHKESKSRKSSLDGLTATEERSINYSVIADQIRRSRESSETKHHSPEKPEPEATPAVVEESIKPDESPPASRARCRKRTEPPDEAPRPINRMHRKSVKYKVDKPEPRMLDAPDETLAADVPVEHKANLSITETNISKTEDVLFKQNFNQSENSETFKNEVVEKKETPVVDKCSSNDAKGPEKKLSKSSSGEKVLKKALKTDKEKSSLAGKKESKTAKSSTGKLKLGSKTNALDNSSALLPISPTQSEKGETETRAVVKPDLIELKADPKESEEIVVVCKLPKKVPTSEVTSKPIPVDQNVVVSIVKGSAKSILVTDGERTTKILNIPTKLEAISENSNSSSGRKREERKEESSQKQAEVNVIHTVVLKGKTKEDSGKVEEVGNNNTRLKSIPDVIQSTISNIPLELNESNITPLSPKSDKQQLLPIKRSTSSDINEVSPASAPLELAKTNKAKKEKVTKPLSTPKSGHSEASLAKQAEKKTDIPSLNNTSNFSSKPDIVQSQITKEKDSDIDSTTSRLKILDPDNSKNSLSEKSLEKTSHFRISTQPDSGTSKPFAAEKSKPYKKSVTVPNVDLGINYKENATSFSSDNIPVSSVENNSKLKRKPLVKVESSGSTVLPQIFSPAQKLDVLKSIDSSAPLLRGTLSESKPGVSKENVSNIEEQSLDQKLVKISNTKQKVSETNELTERSKIADKLISNVNDSLGTKSVSKNENSSLSNIQKDSETKSIKVELNTSIDENKRNLNGTNLIEPVLNKATVAAATSKQEKSNNFSELPKSPKSPKDSVILPDLVSKNKKLEESKPISKTEKLEEQPSSNAGEMTFRTKKVEEKLPDTKQVSKTNDYSKLTDVSKSKLEATSKSTELISKAKIIEAEGFKSKQTISKDGDLSKNAELVSKIKMEDVPKFKEPILKTKLEAMLKITEPTSKLKQMEEDVLSKLTQPISKFEKLEETLSNSEPSSKSKKEDAILKSKEPISKVNSKALSEVTELDSKKKKLEKSLSNTTENVSKPDGVHAPDQLSEFAPKVKVETALTKNSDLCSKIKKEGDSTKPLEPISKVKKLDEATSKNNENVIKRNIEDPVPKPLEPIPKKLETAASNTTEPNSEKKKFESLSNATENVPKKKIDDIYSKQLEPVSKLKKLESASLQTTEPDAKTKISETLSKITGDLTDKKLEGNISYSSETNSEPKKLDKPVQKPIEAVSKNKNFEDTSKTSKQISNSMILIKDTSKTKQTVIPPKMTDNLVPNKKSDEATPKTISKHKTIDKEINKEESVSDSHTSKSTLTVSKEPLSSDTKCNDAIKPIDTPSSSNELESKEPTQPPETISKSKELKKSVSKSESVSKEVVQDLPMPLNASKPCPAPETILEAKKSLVPDLLNHVRLENEASKPIKLDNERLRLPTVAEIPPASPKQEKKPPPPRTYGLRYRYNPQQRSSYSSDSDSSSEEESESISDFSCDEDGNKKGPCFVERRSFSSPDPITPNRIQKSRVRSTLSNQTTITTLSSVEDSPVKPKDPSKKLRFRKYDIDDFVFLKLLGKGSFGKVLLAELKGHDMYFAIKCLRKDVVLEDDDVESTMIERRVLALGTQHPYMCKLYCTFQTKSYLFFVMEYLNGGDLMFHIQESRPFEVKRAMFYGAEIVSALKFLHKRGIVYRDIKLDNVMLDAEGHVRLVDFGMCQCRIYREECMPYNFCGTPNYIAPEIILGQKYNQSVDWWSLGVLLFEMLAGRSPFVGTDEDELFWCICNEEPFYPRFLSKESKDILENLLVKYPNKRLGMPSCPSGEIQDHPFFSTIDWDKLEKKQIPPPFKPTVLSAHDTNNFDSSFTTDSPTLSPVDPEILASMDQEQFQGFSYTNPHTTG